MQVCITGASGFVGYHVTRAFASAGIRMRAIIRPTSDVAHLRDLGADLVVASLNDGPALAAATSGVDVVVHLAALTKARTEAEFRRTNAEATSALVEAVGQEPGRRFVYLSSLAAVGPARNGKPVGRDETPHPLTAYGRTKLEGERACFRAAERIQPVVLRAPAVYGPREKDLYSYFRMASLGVLPSPAGPERHLQFIHVEDLARAVLAAVGAPSAAGVYHVAESRAYAWSEVAGLIAKAVGKKAVPVAIPTPLIAGAAVVSEWIGGLTGRMPIFNREKVRELLADAWLCETNAARAELGFEAKIPLEEGLRSTAEWYRANRWI